MWTTIRKRLWQLRGVLIAVPTVAGAVMGLRLMGALEPLELAALDQFFRLRPVEPKDERVVIVEITEADIQKVKWPISDEMLATLLNRIKQQQPRAIGLDLYRDLPEGAGYQKLVQVFESTLNLIGIQKAAGEPFTLVNPPPVLKQKGQVGANDLVSDGDGKLRRILISTKDKQKQTLLSLGARLALVYLQAEGVAPEALNEQQSRIRLGKAIFEPLDQDAGGYVGVDAGGYQILSNFRNIRQGLRSISLTDVLEGRIPKDFATDRVVLIGSTAESLGDNFYTPYSNISIKGATNSSRTSSSSGVFIHADITSQLISAALDGRPYIKFWSEPAEYSWIFGWAVVGAGVCWAGRYRGLARRTSTQKHKLPMAAIAVAFLLTGLSGGSYLAFLQGWWIPVAPAAIALLGSAAVITGYTAWSASEMRQTFGRYLTDEVVANLLETPEGLKLGGERRIVSVLISDLRGFSAVSEQLSPEKAMSVVNLYLEAMTSIINQYQGTINEFLGDGIFVIFGAPIQRSNDAQRAIACAIAMQRAMQHVNVQLAAKGLPTVEMGIGIHTGEVLAGNVGSHQRAKYTVIGSNVNLASRIESYTVGGQILISDSTFRAAKDMLQIGGQLQMRAKGIREPIDLYDVQGIAGSFNLFLPQEEIELTPLKQPLPVQYRVVEGKSLADELFQGSLVQLSEKSAELRSGQALEVLTNIVISILVEADNASEQWDVYAKVVDILEQDPTRLRIRFTSVPPAVVNFFQTVQVS